MLFNLLSKNAFSFLLYSLAYIRDGFTTKPANHSVLTYDIVKRECVLRVNVSNEILLWLQMGRVSTELLLRVSLPFRHFCKIWTVILVNI